VAAAAAALLVALGVAAWWMWRHIDPAGRALVERILRLPLRDKLRLALALVREPRIPLLVRAIPPALVLYLATPALALVREPRIPLLVRAIPPALVLYLAMPLDVIPDFIPVIGHLDDALVLLLGVAVLLRFTQREVLEEHVARLEAAQEQG